MPSAQHAFGIDGTAVIGERVNFNSECPLDSEFGKPFTAYLFVFNGVDVIRVSFRSNKPMMNYASMCC